MNSVLRLLLLGWLASASTPLLAQEDGRGEDARATGPIIELESRVTGNREQPQVFHVVPWQTPDSPTPDYDPLERQLEAVFGHVERDELQRTLSQRKSQRKFQRKSQRKQQREQQREQAVESRD